MRKVIVAIPTSRIVRHDVIESLINQTVPCEIIINFKKPTIIHRNWAMQKSLNSTVNRNELRKKLLWKLFFLREKPTHVLWIDDDIVLPLNAIEEFLKQDAMRENELINSKTPVMNYVQAGWCRSQNNQVWVCGQWVADNHTITFQKVKPSIAIADFAAISCMFMRINCLKIPFTSGIDKDCSCNGAGNLYLGPAISFCNSLFERGIRIFMNGNVVCEHLQRRAHAVS